MKTLVMTLVISLFAASAFAAKNEKTVVDTSRAAGNDIIEITLTGGAGSQAEKLYKSLTKVEEQADDAMGGRHGSVKQGAAIDCSVENDAHVARAYTCLIKVSTSGESLEPWK